MCMNCGCGQPNDDRGNGANITADDLRRAGDANGQSLRESAQHIVETVELLAASRRDDRGPGGAAAGSSQGLAEPAGAQGARPGGRGTPGSES
jgi:hypothetical protein